MTRSKAELTRFLNDSSWTSSACPRFSLPALSWMSTDPIRLHLYSKALETRRYASLDKWTTQLTSLQGVMLQKSAGAAPLTLEFAHQILIFNPTGAGGPDRSASLGLPGMGSSSNWMGMGGMGLGAFDVWA